MNMSVSVSFQASLGQTSLSEELQEMLLLMIDHAAAVARSPSPRQAHDG
jgi:hypothetical protein